MRVSNRIFQETVAILEAKGYGALTFQDVAEASEVARSTIYRRWPTRAELALDAIAEVVRENVQFPDTGSLKSDLRLVLVQIADFIGSRLGSTVIAASMEIRQTREPSDDPGARWAQRALDVAPMFERAIARGELAADFDWELAFARASGALYFRNLVMGKPNDAAWIDRIMAKFMEEADSVRP